MRPDLIRSLAFVALFTVVTVAHARRRGGGGSDEDLPILKWLLIGGTVLIVGALLLGVIATLFRRRQSNVEAARQRAADRANGR